MPQLYQLYLNYEIIVVDDNITTSIVITETVHEIFTSYDSLRVTN